MDALVEKVECGDSIIVTRMDRLGRSTVQLLQLIETLEKKDVRFRILNLDLDTRGPLGKPIIAILAAFSEMERAMNKEKQKRGIEAARKRGKHLGREAIGYSREGMQKALERYIEGKELVSDICAEYNIPRSSLYAMAKKAGIKR